MPALLYSVPDDGISILKLSMKPVPFNERRDPVADSPYNAFDGDLKTAALYSDFSIEFSKPVTIDRIRVMNGNTLNKDLFKKSNRERDIEITLYTVAPKTGEKTSAKKEKKIKSKKTEKKSVQLKDEKTNDSKDIKIPDKKDKLEKDNSKNEPVEKVSYSVEFEKYDEYQEDNIKLYMAASDTVIGPENKVISGKPNIVKTDQEKKSKKTAKPDIKKNNIGNKSSKKKNGESKTENKKKKKVKTKADKKQIKKDKVTKKKKSAAVPVKTAITTGKDTSNVKSDDKNIIIITDSKKAEKIENVSTDSEKIKEPVKDIKSESEKNIVSGKEIKKESADESKSIPVEPGKDNSIQIEPDKTVDRISLPELKKLAKKTEIPVKKTGKKRTDKKVVKGKTKTDSSEKGKSADEKNDKNKIEIVESKNIKEKVSIPSAEKKIIPDKKISKTKNEKKDNEKLSDTKTNKKEPLKIQEKKEKENKQVTGNQDVQISKEDLTIKKMTGIVRIKNDSNGRVFVYTTLKDSMDFQNLNFNVSYSVTKINFRTRDDEYYHGSENDRASITEIQFSNKGKIIRFNGIDSLKKSYAERFNKTLTDAIAGETFIMYDNNETVLRMIFKKDGGIEFYDRFKCTKKGGADCTSVSMPDRWKVTDGKLLMRFNTLWRVWKYELDSQSDMLDEKNEQTNSSGWMKIYYRSENGFSDRYLDLVRSEKGIWAR